jgi:RES domain-containing protein
VEILVHYEVLPDDFQLTPISIPDSVVIADVPTAVLSEGWDAPAPTAATQEYGRRWAEGKEYVVLRVPSAVIRGEANFVINVLHPEFPALRFGPSKPFRFDPRLK